MGEDFGIGYAMGQDSNGGGGGNNGGLFGGNNDWLGIILLIALLGGGFGGRGFGGGGGMMGGGGGGCGLVTTADLCGQFNFNNLENSVRGVQQGICDSTYALNNAIMGGFHSVDNAICNLGFNVQQGFNTMGYQNQQCCCETQRLIERGFCDTNYNLATNTANIVNAGHADTDRVIAKLDAMENARQQEKIEALRMENQTLRFQASQANQNAFITANQEAQTAELIRRLDPRPCPTAAYLVQPPTPVNFPINGCGTVQFGYNGYGNGCGCGCAA